MTILDLLGVRWGDGLKEVEQDHDLAMKSMGLFS